MLMCIIVSCLYEDFGIDWDGSIPDSDDTDQVEVTEVNNPISREILATYIHWKAYFLVSIMELICMQNYSTQFIQCPPSADSHALSLIHYQSHYCTHSSFDVLLVQIVMH